MATTKAIERTNKTYTACCDIYNETDGVVLRMEMPGVTKDSLSINVDNDRLIIDGKRTLPHADSNFLVREIRHGDYHHEFSIDDTIDRDKIEATLSNGVAIVTLGMKEALKPRKIKIDIK